MTGLALVLAAACAAVGLPTPGAPARRGEGCPGRGFAGIADEQGLAVERSADAVVLTSTEIPTGIAADEIVVSWNVEGMPAGVGLKVEARALCGGRWTKYYTLGLWSTDPERCPRESVDGQADADGDVRTDTLALTRPAERTQVRFTLGPVAGERPRLKYVGVSFADTRTRPPAREPNRRMWGRELAIPGRSQIGYAEGKGWCSPASVAMVLAFWATVLGRPELDVPVPAVAGAVRDRVWNGTGNWPFNTAFAGSFAGMRACVARLCGVRDLEDWAEAGIPPVVSLSYDLLLGREEARDAGHLMICAGFTREGDVVLYDPWTHPDRGEAFRKVFARDRFERAWAHSKETVYLIYPQGARLPRGAPGGADP